MFEHSIKVPRLYKFAASVCKQVKEEGASLKERIYKVKHNNLKGIYALAAEVLKHSNVLDYIIRSTQLLIKETRLDPWLARVLITELLWGKKRLPNASKPCQTILNYQNELTECLSTFTDDVVPREIKKVNKPRYVRVNTLKITVLEAVDIFRDEGWILLRCGSNSDYGSFLATVSSLSSDQFVVDMHIKELLIFPPNTQFYQHHLYLKGDIILQDKASCLAPLLLSPTPKSSVLDMCSAPGMKASQLAAMIGEDGTVYAIERDQRRFKTLCELMENMGMQNVKCVNKDVMTVTEKDFPDIEFILVDPSCSGSGMLDRLEFENRESKCNQSRLQSLAGFQITILRHALSNFSTVKRVIYSTCSLYPEENESVVKQVIQSISHFKLVDLGKEMSSKWFNFGSDDFGEIGNRCLYAKPEQDLSNGFFVALFERINNDEKNDFFVKRIKRSSECEIPEDKQNENYEYNEDYHESDKNFEVVSKEKADKKQKKKKTKVGNISEQYNKENEESPPLIKNKKQKKKKSANISTETKAISTEEINNDESNIKPKHKKKKKSINNETEEHNEEKSQKPKNKSRENTESEEIVEEIKQRKRKKSKKDNESFETMEEGNKIKRKKKSKPEDDINNENIEIQKKCKKSKKEKYEDDISVTRNKKRKENIEIHEIKSQKKKKSKNCD